MRDLETLGRKIVSSPPVTPLPFDEIQRRAHRRSRRRHAGTAVTIGLLVALLASVAIGIRAPDRRSHAQESRRPAPTYTSEIDVGEALGVAADTHSVWVTGVDVVRRIDPSANAVVATIPVPGTSDIRSVSLGHGSVWVTDTGTQRVTRIDPTTNQVVASIAVAGSPTGTAAASGFIWVALPDPVGPGISFVPIDPGTDAVGAPIRIESGGPDPFPTLDSDGTDVVVHWADRAWILDPSSRRVERADPARLHGVGAAATDQLGVLVIDHRGRIIRLEHGRVGRIGATIPGGFRIVGGGDSDWVLARRDARSAPTLTRLHMTTLRPVGHPTELATFPAGLAPQLHRAWVATDGTVVRVDVGPRPTRIDLCSSPTPIEYQGADALPPVSGTTGDVDGATRELRDQLPRLKREYPAATNFTVGPGRGRAWTRERGRVVITAVEDVAIIAHFAGQSACPQTASSPVGSATTHNIPVLLAADGAGAPRAVPMTVRHLRRPGALAVDRTGALLVCDANRILRRRDDGTFDRVAGTGRTGFAPDGTPALDADLDCGRFTVGPEGTIYFVDDRLVRTITPQGRIRTVAGNDQRPPDQTATTPSPALATALWEPNALTVAPDGQLWITDGTGIRFLDAQGNINTWRVGGLGSLTIAEQAVLFSPSATLVDVDHTVWVSNSAPKQLVHFSPDGQVLGQWDLYLAQMILDPAGGLIVADYGRFAVEHVTDDGTITTLVPSQPGPGLRGFRPESVAITTDGHLYASSDQIVDPNQYGVLVRDRSGIRRIR